MNKPYFVMLTCEDGESIIPLMDKNNQGNVARFKDPVVATNAGSSDELGKKYGFEIFEVYTGIAYHNGQK